MRDSTREAFEAWIAAPPFERSIERHGEGSAWCGGYIDIAVDLAWYAWLEGDAQRLDKVGDGWTPPPGHAAGPV